MRAIGSLTCSAPSRMSSFSRAAGRNRTTWLCSAWLARIGDRGRHLICASTEHHAVLHAFEHLGKREAFEVTLLPVDHGGRIDPDDLERAIRSDTILVSIMAANNETGVLQPMEELADICEKRGVLLHSDMVQSFGKLETRLGESGLAAASFAAHKFHGPKGAGLLYLRAGLPIEAVQFGGAHENQRRPGTENVPAIVGMAAAAEWALRDRAREQEREGGVAGSLMESHRGFFPRRDAKRRHDASAREYAQRQLRGLEFGNNPDGPGSGRSLRLERFGLHGGIGRRLPCAAGDGFAGNRWPAPPFAFR